MHKRILVVVLGLVLGASEVASAGGTFLHTRGVRPTARAGAFVAGANDLGAMWFNPAGLVAPEPDKKKKVSFLFDMAFVDHSATYTRVDSGNNRHDPVSNEAMGKVIPTVGIGYRVSDKIAVAAGLFAPYAGLDKFPENGPQRYSLIDASESAAVVLEAAVAYKVSDRIRIGVGVQNMIFQAASTVVFSGCPQEVACAPEDPEFDSVNKLQQLDLFIPSGVVGVQLDLGKKASAGFSFQFPFSVSANGELQSRLPESGFYDGAVLVGDRADMSFTLPPILRAGLELRPSSRAKVEITGSIEFWSVHDKFIVEPRNVRIENTPGLGTYEFSTVEISRDFRNSFSIAVGGELTLNKASGLTVLGGYAFETSAVGKRTLSVFTIDGNKHLLSGGIARNVGKWQVNATLGFVKVADRSVSPEEGRATQLSPLRDPDGVPAVTTYVNWGDYSSSYLIAGAGISTQF